MLLHDQPIHLHPGILHATISHQSDWSLVHASVLLGIENKGPCVVGGSDAVIRPLSFAFAYADVITLWGSQAEHMCLLSDDSSVHGSAVVIPSPLRWDGDETLSMSWVFQIRSVVGQSHTLLGSTTLKLESSDICKVM